MHPVDITDQCYLQTGVMNQVRLTYTNTLKRYAVVVCLMKVILPETLMQILLSRPPLTKEQVYEQCKLKIFLIK
jgi:hypothetical protein